MGTRRRLAAAAAEAEVVGAGDCSGGSGAPEVVGVLVASSAAKVVCSVT